ncbi:MAG: glycosyltransferase family 39 protein [Elusimicrobia bacterium]|nr:glycosyltransferase family 39 protein [Elusimicrobiota bacterium]
MFELMTENDDSISLTCYRWLLAVIVLAGLVLRLHRLGDRGFWMDEINLWISCFSSYRSAGTGPLPPVIYGGFMRLVRNSDAFVFHLPSVFFGTLFIPAMALLAAAISGRRAGLFAAFLSAISPMAIYYSQEARPYAVMLVLCTLSYLSFIRGYIKGEPRWGWVFFLSLFAGFTNHALTSHVVGGLAIYLGLQGLRTALTDKKTNDYLVICFASMAGLLWLWTRFLPLNDFGGFYRLPLWEYAQSIGYALGPVARTSTGHDGRALETFAALAYFAAVAFGWLTVRKIRPGVEGAFACVMALSLAILYVTLGERTFWPWSRYLCQILPVYVVLAAVGFARVGGNKRKTQAAAAVAAFAIVYPGLRFWHAHQTFNRSETAIVQATALARAGQRLNGAILIPNGNSDPLWDVAAVAIYRRDAIPTYYAGNESQLRLAQPYTWERGLPVFPAVNPPSADPLPAGYYALLSTEGLVARPDCKNVSAFMNVQACEESEPVVVDGWPIPVAKINRPG